MLIDTNKSKRHNKLLLLTKKLELAPKGGRELLCKLNYDSLHSIYSDRMVLFELMDGGLRDLCSIINAFRGHIDGVNNTSIGNALLLIRESEVSQVFVDGSNLGGFVQSLKLNMPHVEVTTFFHNVEARFFLGSLRLEKTLHALGVLVANTLAERKAVKYSDKIVCLSERDSCLLKRLYGRGATHIAPMVLEDQSTVSYMQVADQSPERFALFVGGSFYANKTGIEWFVREVSPRIDLPVYIVGRGFENFREEFEIPGKVIVVGAVHSLEDWYRRAQFVIAPIFDGSGMKTKVAEALMYGKKVVGTPEAFSGYEDICDQAGWVCITVNDFIIAIQKACAEITQSFDISLRMIYEQRYSMSAAKDRLIKILKKD